MIIPTDSRLTEIGKFAFDQCSKLSSINLPSSIRRLESGCFSDCKSLEKLTLPEGLLEIEQGAFTNAGIKSLHLQPVYNL